MYFYWSLAGSLAILFPFIFLFSASTGGGASDWSLATGFNAEVLVTCMVACAESGVSWKSLVLEESIQLHQVTWTSAWSLAINFNGNQGSRLSSCRRKFRYMYLIQFFTMFRFQAFKLSVTLQYNVFIVPSSYMFFLQIKSSASFPSILILCSLFMPLHCRGVI